MLKKKSKKSLSRKESSKKSLMRPLMTSEYNQQNNTIVTTSGLALGSHRNNTMLTQQSARSRMVNGVNIPHISLEPESTYRNDKGSQRSHNRTDENAVKGMDMKYQTYDNHHLKVVQSERPVFASATNAINIPHYAGVTTPPHQM